MPRGPLPAGRSRPPEVIEAHGEDEAAALTYLALALEERHGAERRVEIGQRARMAYIAGAEEESRRAIGRGLTGKELERQMPVLRSTAKPGPLAPPRAVAATSAA